MDGRILPNLTTTAIEAAIVDEASFNRNFLPPEPWWPGIVDRKEQIAQSIERAVSRGTAWPLAKNVFVRKPGHGIRPVAVTTPDARILYRALASLIVPSDLRPDRSATSYADFVMAPVRAAYDGAAVGPHRIGDAKFSHVVLADISAFYDFIDHRTLRDELDLLGAPIEEVDAMIELVGEISGRTFGIPQRSEPSDWLSEVYAQRLDRALVRAGFQAWRYNDDFRIGCESYGIALQAIEDLSVAARDSGLVINDQKLATARFVSYLVFNTSVEQSDASLEIDPADVEAAVSLSYELEDDDQAIDTARDDIARRFPHGELVQVHDPITSDDLGADEHRTLRRAINTLTRHRVPDAVPALLDLLAYQPAMTYQVVRYAVAVSDQSPEVTTFLTEAIERVSLTDWQAAWLAYALRATSAPVSANDANGRWLRGRFSRSTSSYSAAESSVTLAMAGLTTFPELEHRIRHAPASFTPWYLHAIDLLRQAGSVSSQQIGALRRDSSLAEMILG